MSTNLRQIPLTCSGHTRPVVHLDFNREITECGYFLISACKGESERTEVVIPIFGAIQMEYAMEQNRWVILCGVWTGLLGFLRHPDQTAPNAFQGPRGERQYAIRSKPNRYPKAKPKLNQRKTLFWFGFDFGAFAPWPKNTWNFSFLKLRFSFRFDSLMLLCACSLLFWRRQANCIALDVYRCLSVCAGQPDNWFDVCWTFRKEKIK